MLRTLDLFTGRSAGLFAKASQEALGDAKEAKPGLALGMLLIALVSSAAEAAPVTVVPGSPAAYIFFPKQLNP